MYSKSRIQLLSNQEIESIYAMPQFNKTERALYFSLTDNEMRLVKKYRTIKAKVYFIRLLGYFKAKQQFYKFDLAYNNVDTQSILEKYFGESLLPLSGKINFKTYYFQKNDILTLLHYQDWSSTHEPKIQLRINELLKLYPKGHDTLRQLLNYFDTQQIVVPSYRTLQDLFTKAFSQEGDRLNQLLLLMPLKQQENLSELIERGNGINKLNTIRSDQKDFTYTAISSEVEKALLIVELYEFSKDFLPILLLSKNAIRYYADLTELQYAAFRLRRLSKPQQWLYAICFIYHRYQQIMNNLITSFMYHTRAIMQDAKVYSEKEAAAHHAALVTDFPNLAKFLKWFPNRKPGLNHDELNKEAYRILPEEQFPTLAQFLEGNIFDKKAAKKEFYLESSRLFALYLRPIVLAVSFEFYKKDNDIMPLIELIKNHYGSGKSPGSFKLPDEIKERLSKTALPYLKKNETDENIDPHLFEFFIYQKIYRRLDKGLLCCNDSVSFCDIDHDLVDDILVDDVVKISNEFGFPKIPIYCDQWLDETLIVLDQIWDKTTQRINAGENTGFNVKATKSGQLDWTLLYDGQDKLDDSFFKTLPRIDIIDIIIYLGDRINLLGCFTHIKERYSKNKQPMILPIVACILANAFGISIEKMAELCDLNFNLLRSTQENFIRIETLCTTNDITCNLIYSLPIFKAWNLMGEKLLGDADGQKLPTTESTIQSRYSKKYLGKSPGISVYTLIANSVAVNAKNIGLNEYEGHSLYDMIYGNKTDIEIDMVTGDGHSLNQLNFVVLDSINVDYVPSIKNIQEAANDLCSIKQPDYYKGIIKPSRVINKELIKSEKRGILRVLLSLLLQANTQSNIIKKVNSYARYKSLKKALFEYNNIFKSIHVLNLIDDMTFRKAIRTARNRTESYHQLQGFIRKVYHGIFKGKKVVNNRISAHAIRLLANCVIAYNSIILNTIYEKMIQDGVSKEIINEFLRISPIAWVHIIFTGKYNFKKSNGDIDMNAIVSALEDHLKQHFWKTN